MEGGSVNIFSRSNKYRDNWDIVFKPKSFYDFCDEETRKHANQLIENIKSGKLKERNPR